ncbi:HSP70-domain-containing protein [Neocallimastix lanati (nom. inval.)]|nr:HSP70-domain-containing protein [Neocallimastix sp. JGI-2020a]
MKKFTVGIDLGTVNARIGTWNNGHFEIIEFDNSGKRYIPSCISFNENELLIGNRALYQSQVNLKNTIFDIKRIIGLDFNDKMIHNIIKSLPFTVCSINKKPYVQVKYKNEVNYCTIEEITSMILLKMKENVEEFSNESVIDAVITIPTYFTSHQRDATINAGILAGFNIIDCISETYAAAIAYKNNNNIENKENILIINLGGSFYEASLFSISKGDVIRKGTDGDSTLGGEIFNDRLINHFIKEINTEYEKDIKTDPKYFEILTRLRLACEEAKRKLSFVKQCKIEIINLFDGINFEKEITREFFENLNKDLFEKLINPIEYVIHYSKISKSDVSDIILIGGSTRIPKVRDIISTCLDGKELKSNINSDEAVTQGAAIHSSILSMDNEEENKKLNELFNKSNEKNMKENLLINTNDPEYKNINKLNKEMKKELERIESMNNLESFIYEERNKLIEGKYDEYFSIIKESIEEIKKRYKNKKENNKLKSQLENKMNLIHQMNEISKRNKAYETHDIEEIYENYKNELKKSFELCLEWIKRNSNASIEVYDNKKNELVDEMKLIYQMIEESENVKKKKSKVKEMERKVFMNNLMNFINKECNNLIKGKYDEYFSIFKKSIEEIKKRYKNKKENNELKLQLENKINLIHQMNEISKRNKNINKNCCFYSDIYKNYKIELIESFKSRRDWIKKYPNASIEEYNYIKNELMYKMKSIHQIIEEYENIKKKKRDQLVNLNLELKNEFNRLYDNINIWIANNYDNPDIRIDDYNNIILNLKPLLLNLKNIE